MADNLVSRCIGFTVRFLVLLTASAMMLGVAVFGVLSVVVWPLIPFGAALLLVKGITG
jgi:hypothetical protein